MGVEEVLVVHHEALQKVDFLLRHDELTSCESPAMPECVTAVRRAKILKRLMPYRTKGQPPRGRQDSAGACAARGGQEEEDSDDGDPSDEDNPGDHFNAS